MFGPESYYEDMEGPEEERSFRIRPITTYYAPVSKERLQETPQVRATRSFAR